jgi:glycosyltransferase involved in cell wall biosynthesis
MKDEQKNIRFIYNSKKNFFSIIIPVYKDSVGLEDTLRSLLNQCEIHFRYEIIVANDGSDPDISRICKKYQVREVGTSHGGSYSARNRALELSKGEYIAFLDADVRPEKNWLKMGYNALKQYDYVGGKVSIDAKKIVTISNYYDYLTAFDNENYIQKDHFLPTANLFVKRKVIEQVGGFDGRLFSCGDLEFGNRVYASKKFEQGYIEGLSVVHPPRNYSSLMRKILRVRCGLFMLSALYPNRYPHLRKGIILCIALLLKVRKIPFYKIRNEKVPIFFTNKINIFFLLV